MLDKLEAIEERYIQIEQQLSEPDALSDIKKFAKLNKEYKELTKVHNAYLEYKNLTSNIQNAKDMMYKEKDEEMKNMANFRTPWAADSGMLRHRCMKLCWS